MGRSNGTTPVAAFQPRGPSPTLGDYPTFVAKVLSRLERGSHTYGDESFTLAPEVLTEEIEQEILDLMGWGYILWCRLRSLERDRLGIRKEPEQP